jgi:predicted enzyme related to lactoylglutathione lyase
MAPAESPIHYLEIVTPDVEAVRTAYEKIGGFHFRSQDPVLGNAYVADLPSGSMCGIRAPMHGGEKPVVRPYLRVNDLKISVETAVQLGAKVMLEYMELPGHGKIAIYELGGIEQGLWQVE